MKHQNNMQSVEIPIKLKCGFCSTSWISQHEQKGHTEGKQKPNLSHTSKLEDNKCHICNEKFKENVDFNSHMVN